MKDARFLLSLREDLVGEEKRLATRRMALARSYWNDRHSPDEQASGGEVGV